MIGMSIAYVASFAGLVFAWVGWRKRRGGRDGTDGIEDSGSGPGPGRKGRDPRGAREEERS